MYKGVIYQAINIQNKKSYIGKTVRNFECRKREHLNPNSENFTYFYNAIKKYGGHNFKWIILGIIESYNLVELEELLKQAEIECIWLFRTFGSDGENPDGIYGYNLTKGGDGTSGYKCSEGIIEKNRLWHLGRTGGLCPNSKQVFQYSLEGDFIRKYDAVADAQRITGINNILSCVINKQKTAGDYFWTYDFLGNKINLNIQYNYFLNFKKIGKFDLQHNLIKEYSSIKEAKKENRGDINNALKNNSLTQNKFYWKYL